MILDTCALLWLAEGDHKKFSKKTLEMINKTPEVSIVAITGFEIGIKCQAGKLVLPANPREWISEILDFHGIGMIRLDMEICIRATELPPIHKDPCDRLIIAAALINDLSVVTADRRFIDYGINVLS